MLIRIKIFYSNLISNSKALQLFSHREHNHAISVFWLQLQKCGKDNPKKNKREQTGSKTRSSKINKREKKLQN